MTTIQVPLDALRAHPMNANAMSDERFEKLVAHIGRTGWYPPLIVRPTCDAGVYELLDGHHRCAALARLGRDRAACVVWDADDEQALVLLATLNRLQGADDPVKRGRIFEAIAAGMGLGAEAMQAMLPETVEQIGKLRAAAIPPPAPAPPRPKHDLPVAVYFFLTPRDRDALESALAAIGGPRDAALVELVSAFSGGATPRVR